MEGTSADGNNVACIYLFLFFPKGHFLLAGNSILCVHECACWRALQDSESKRRNRFILHSVEKLIWGWNRDLFNVAGSKPHVGRQCWQSNSTNFIFVLVHLKIISCRLNIRSRSHKCHTKSAKPHHWSVFKKKSSPWSSLSFTPSFLIPSHDLDSSSLSNQKCTGNHPNLSSASRRSRPCQHACTQTEDGGDEACRVVRDELAASASLDVGCSPQRSAHPCTYRQFLPISVCECTNVCSF